MLTVAVNVGLISKLTLETRTVLLKTNSSAKITIPRITFNQVPQFKTMTNTRKQLAACYKKWFWVKK